ncbi:MAG: tryptophan-rich sensory protein [Bacilli bacterium]|nr:tryptophan-rich sensory protein [Bacilli bacterium]
MKFKKFLVYLLFLLPWFLSGFIFKVDTSYYLSLNLPWFAPPPIVFGVVWPILYILIAYTVYKTFPSNASNYKIYLVINYLANQLYTFCFFTLQNNFLGLVDAIIVLISSLYLYVETKMLKGNVAKYLIPYVIWNIFALILSFTIFFIN